MDNGMKDSTINKWLENGLIWLPKKGMGYYPVKDVDEPYDEKYFANYQKLADTPIGIALNKARVDLVRKHFDGTVLDVGIGAGTFIESHGNAIGTDVNSVGIQWLKNIDSLWDGCDVEGATFWDSLEHLPNPDDILSKITDYVFVSIPIFDNCYHLLKSKHFKTSEHRWYFTEEGFINWMYDKGFELVEMNRMEEEIGREDIGTYVFKRYK
jgi:hypothetical protein